MLLLCCCRSGGGVLCWLEKNIAKKAIVKPGFPSHCGGACTRPCLVGLKKYTEQL